MSDDVTELNDIYENLIDDIDDGEIEISNISEKIEIDQEKDKLDDDTRDSNLVLNNDNENAEIVSIIEKEYTKRKIIVNDTNRKTTDRITLAEKTELIGLRATLIEKNSTIFVNNDNLIHALDIATLEFNLRKFPLYIHRLVHSYIDHNEKKIVELYEIVDPNISVHP